MRSFDTELSDAHVSTKKTLAGKRVLITRAAEQAPGLAALLEAEGAEVLTLSAISIEPAADYQALDQALRQIEQYQWVIFTSVNGVRAVGQRLDAIGQDWRSFQKARVAAIGPATAEALRKVGVQPEFVPAEYVAEAITAGIGEVAGLRILLPRADIAREALAIELRQRGAIVEEIAAYRTVTQPLDTQTIERVLASHPDVITFTSSSTVRGFLTALYGVNIGEALRGVAVACIGPITARTAREAGLTPQIIAEEYTMPGLTRAIVAYFGAFQGEQEPKIIPLPKET